jgi:hypothetical protein
MWVLIVQSDHDLGEVWRRHLQCLKAECTT